MSKNSFSPVIPIEEAFAQALEAPFKIPEMTEAQKKVALQRRWAQAFPDEPVSEDYEALSRKVIPSDLTEEELQGYLYGAMEEAKHVWLKIFNTSYNRKLMNKRFREAGVHNCLQAFDPKTEKELRNALRFVTDG